MRRAVAGMAGMPRTKSGTSDVPVVALFAGLLFGVYVFPSELQRNREKYKPGRVLCVETRPAHDDKTHGDEVIKRITNRCGHAGCAIE